MNVRVPQGGFFAATVQDSVPPGELSTRLEKTGARVVIPGSKDAVLAAWTEFPGQGIWRGPDSIVAYDLDLTNEEELRTAAEVGQEEVPDLGELLWRLYREEGTGFIDRLRGPFAFALWDERHRRLIVATDPYGIRPVVYANLERGLVAASRIRHVLLHPGVSRDIDEEAVYAYLFFSAIPSPLTIYKHARKLEPGRLISSENGRTELTTHYDLRYHPDGAGESYWRKAIPIEVRRAVARFVPLSDPETTGCFLSGGTDSSSVAGCYTKVAGRSAKTFSIGFDEPGYNEMEFAHIAARHFGTEQHDYFVTPGDVLALIEALPAIYDEPFGNSSVIPTFYCAQMAKADGVDILLAGDGGDEIFGGNERYVTNLVFERYGAVPGFLRRWALEPLLGVLPPQGPFYKAQRYVRRASMPNPARFFSYNLLAENPPDQIFRPEFLAQVDPGCFLRLAQAHYDRAAPAHDTDRLLYIDMKFTITDNDLRKVTEMTEAAGVRVRYPLLDRDLVDFTCTIPPTLKVKPGKNRYIFKRAMEGFLPDEIIRKTKHGFGLPIGPWFQKVPELSSLLSETLFSGVPRITQWVQPRFLAHLRHGFETESASYYGANLWVLLMLERWMKNRESEIVNR